MAAAGMKFTRFYSGNAVCAPSRCCLMTGKHPGHATVRDNKEQKPEGQFHAGNRYHRRGTAEKTGLRHRER